MSFPSPSWRRSGVALAVAMLLIGCSSPSPSPAASASSAGAPSIGASEAASPSVAPTLAQTPTPAATPQPRGPDRIALELVTAGLSDPIGIVNAGDGSDRLFVQERDGRVRVVEANGSLRAAPFVDLTDRVGGGGERGLLGLAFHPDFERNRRLFVYYSRVGDGAMVVSELTASTDLARADPAGERALLTVADQYANHNGGQLAFGPDGYLYIGFGDGGGGGDPLRSGQSTQTLLGKILRIDIDGAVAAGKQYAIPARNPYAAGGASPGGGLPEIWAYGLRNPWRFSFDRANGDLYIGDVGQGDWEEINRQAGTSPGGENYGWNAYEGNHCYSSCQGVTAVPPIAEYNHQFGCSVTGGYVYRGSRQPLLVGVYLYGDYCTGTIWTVPSGVAAPDVRIVAATSLQISSFGEGEDGEIYLVDLGGGSIYRVVVDA
jgi:glucose/arabinose dehydrogenase